MVLRETQDQPAPASLCVLSPEGAGARRAGAGGALYGPAREPAAALVRQSALGGVSHGPEQPVSHRARGARRHPGGPGADHYLAALVAAPRPPPLAARGDPAAAALGARRPDLARQPARVGTRGD